MFKFLKDKLKSAVGSLSKKVEEEAPEEEQEIEVTREVGEEEQSEPIDADSVEPVEEVPQDELQQAEDMLDRAQGEVTPEEIYEKATGVSAEKALQQQEQKEEVEAAVSKVQKQEPEPIIQLPEEEKTLSEEEFLGQEEVTKVEEQLTTEEITGDVAGQIDFSDISETAVQKPQEDSDFQDKYTLEPEPSVEEPVQEKKGFFGKLKSKFKKEEKEEAKKHEQVIDAEEATTSEVEETLEKLEKTLEEQPEEKLAKSETPKEETVQEAPTQDLVPETKTTKEAQATVEKVPSLQELAEKKEQEEQEEFQPKKIIREEPKKKGLFAKIKEKVVTKKISPSQFDDLFWELEVALLENNVALEVIEKIKQDLKKELVDQPIPRSAIQQTIMSSLKDSLESLFSVEGEDLLKQIEQKGKKPFVICFVGINGSGKTTTIAKVANLLQQNGKSVVMAAADTFRAAAIDQLEEHANNLKIKLIKHDYGSDAAAVSFDAIKHAEAKGIDVVLIDTAGRLHSNTNLVDEMKKIVKIAQPDSTIFIGESITGNDCVEQAVKFNEAVGVDGIILSKADIDEKGGAAISISFVTQKPILYLGTGQEYKDIKPFNPQEMLKTLGL